MMSSHVIVLTIVTELALFSTRSVLSGNVPNMPFDDPIHVFGATSLRGDVCHFPFIYNGQAHYHCIPHPFAWCGITDNVDRDNYWGNCLLENCVHTFASEARHYVGDIDTTRSGTTCQAWQSDIPNAQNYNNDDYPDIEEFPEDNWDEISNHCRSPDNDDRTWCYTTDPNTRWDYCSISECDLCQGSLFNGTSSFTLNSSSVESYEGEMHSELYGDINHVSGYNAISDSLIVGAWCAASTDTSPWIEVAYEEIHKIYGIVTRGRDVLNDSVLIYTVSYMDETGAWALAINHLANLTAGENPNEFYGLANTTELVPHKIVPNIFSQYVRINLLDWYYFPCMRFDLRACPDTDQCVGGQCLNGATCYDMVEDFYCACVEGWTGDTCDEMIDLCETQTDSCENGGACTMIGVLSYTCSCVTGYSGDSCETGVLKDCEEVALSGATISGLYTMDMLEVGGGPSDCYMMATSTGAWDYSNEIGFSTFNDLNLEQCEMACIEHEQCLSINYLVDLSPHTCILRDFYAYALVTRGVTMGSTKLKACPGPKKVYCDLSNTTMPVTMAFPSIPSNYSGMVAGQDWDYRTHEFVYLPLLQEEIEYLKGNSLQCLQTYKFYCLGSMGQNAKLLFNNGQFSDPKELNSENLANPACDCVLGDNCDSSAPVVSTGCQCEWNYGSTWYLDSETFVDQDLIPIPGVLTASLSSAYREMRIDLEPFSCMQLTIDFDYCSLAPCSNGGVCTSTGRYTFECACVNGYEGDSCETQSNECDSDPCQNGGVCADMLNEYICMCEDGYEGDHCETELNECDSDPCMNAASCVNQVDRYRCSCQPGWSGITCATELIECDSTPCQNAGTCEDLIGGFNCTCATGYEGAECQYDTDDCAGDPCVNGACVDQLGGFECVCDNGYGGTFCENEIDECFEDPCLNGATCLDQLALYACLCADGFIGHNCETDVDECISQPCHQGSCLNEAGGFTCDCYSGYTGDLCDEEIDECQDDPCGEHGRCVDSLGGFACECDPGFEGEDCSYDTDECLSYPCLNGGTCQHNISRFECECIVTIRDNVTVGGFAGERCQYEIRAGGWGSWGAWSDCTVQCGHGVQTRIRRCDNPTQQFSEEGCEGDYYQTQPCTANTCDHVDGGWGAWQEWGRCSVTCGPGNTVRHRECDNPTQQGNGAPCVGSPENTLQCNEWECGMPLDGRWSSWGSWGECSVSCGLGSRVRHRACDDPPAVYGGAPCIAESEGASPCLMPACPAYDDCSATWSEWSDCSASCGEGTYTRQRSCSLQASLRSDIEGARARQLTGTETEEDASLPDWYFTIELQTSTYRKESCQAMACPNHQCVECSSNFNGLPHSLTCKGPKVTCSTEYPYCVHNFNPRAAIPQMSKGCASVGTCSANATSECESLKKQALEYLISDSEVGLGVLAPHPDTLFSSWQSIEESCDICCQHSMCNRNNLPTSPTIYNTAAPVSYNALYQFICVLLSTVVAII